MNFLGLNLKIDLPAIQLGMVRNEKFCGTPRERVTSEKYFRQAIQVFNKDGKLVDSGFVQINDYTNMCQMVRLCNKSKKTFHLFEKWEHCGNEFYKTNEFSVTDLATGNIVGSVLEEYVSSFVKNTCDILKDKDCCIIGDLEKDEYSKVLLECLNEYSNSNRPQMCQSSKNYFEEQKSNCDCNLLEELDIEYMFRNGEIDEDRRDSLLDKLACNCQNKESLPELLTEEQQPKRAELRIKAQAEIAEVFAMKESEKLTNQNI